MKTYYLNIQSKGGAGKSMLTYLQALKHENNPESLFVDLDNSTRTSLKQLKFLSDKKRLVETDITDSFKRIEREKLFKVLESLNELSFTEYFLDFGAPESEQFTRLFTIDFSAEELKAFETELDATFVFNIIISGGPAYLSCMDYMINVTGPLRGLFPVYLFVNEFSFQSHPELIEEVKQYAMNSNGLVTGTKLFGNIHIDRHSGQGILEFVKEGKGLSEYKGFVTNTIIRRELSKL